MLFSEAFLIDYGFDERWIPAPAKQWRDRINRPKVLFVGDSHTGFPSPLKGLFEPTRLEIPYRVNEVYMDQGRELFHYHRTFPKAQG
ncbi:hypothetical protein [Caballeronia sordidicola]|jgi:hypothetical protein|uniref:hypothetical protein n=1 Tax=Caballeronia sordidicola TaxID=196367 RepID=UPI000689A9B7|nr:hypothetical protein [Caballeronia sordidicola]